VRVAVYADGKALPSLVVLKQKIYCGHIYEQKVLWLHSVLNNILM